ncbi:MAG: hypothetical protein JW915_00770 [Chitinispirillaceae bacterium]|nr:hypothetical protein [Chitinispirillaceae bacterium]
MIFFTYKFKIALALAGYNHFNGFCGRINIIFGQWRYRISFVSIGIYGMQGTPSEVFPASAIGVGVIGITITNVGLNVSLVGIVKFVNE